MQGKELAAHCPDQVPGITPAYAGNSPARPERGLALQDHPHVCGEKSLGIYFFNSRQGSPPRVRGKVKLFGDFDAAFWITPACAGKSDRDKNKKKAV